MDYMCLRNCYVGEVLRKEGKVYTLPDEMDKDTKNFRPLDIPAELHEQVAEDVLNDEHEAKMKVVNKPEKMRKGYYFCTECQTTHNGTMNRKGKVGKIAKRHLKYKG